MSATENDFIQRISDAGLTLERFLMVNEPKRQATALVRGERDQRAVAKWAADGQGAGLAVERAFYESAVPNEHCVALLRNEEDLLILEYVDSKTLRRWLCDQLGCDSQPQEPALIEEVLRNYIRIFTGWHGGGNFGYTENTRVTLLRLYGKILTSGPADTVAAPDELAQNRVVNRLSRPVLDLMSRRLSYSHGVPSRPIHADMHLNNLLVAAESYQVKIIDWENTSEGSPLIDLLYSAAMVRALLHDRQGHLARFDRMILAITAEFDDPTRAAFHLFYGAFGSAILLNRRFLIRPNPGFRALTVLRLFRSLFRRADRARPAAETEVKT